MKNNVKIKTKLLTCLCTICAIMFLGFVGATTSVAKAEGETSPVLTMKEGAAIRTFAPTGIRFVSELSKSDYETLSSKNAEFYTLIIPANLVTESGITAENYESLDAEYIKAENSIEICEDKVTFSGTLVGTENKDGTYADYFPESAYNMAMTAVSYYTYTENDNKVVVFASNPQTYSVAYIASVLELSGKTDPYYTEITDAVLSEGFTFGSASYSLYQGETLDTVLNSKGLKVAYASDKDSVVSVSADGKLTGVSVGTATISATLGNKTASVSVTVKSPIAINGTYDLSLEGETSSITPSQTIDGTISKVVSENIAITEGVSFADSKLTFTKSALQTLLGDKNYAEGLEIEIFADERYTATINIATMFIDSADDLKNLTTANTSATIDAYYIVINDIDATSAGTVRFVNNDTQSDDTLGFKGIFDGRGHIISNITTSATAYNGLGGLFGMLQAGSVVKNVAFTNVTMTSEYKYVITGESKPFYGTIENVVITAADGITLDRVVSRMLGGTMKNCLFVGFAQLSENSCATTVSNVMSVTTNASEGYGGFSWTGNATYNAQPNYASINAMLDALKTENKLTNWGSITYNNGAIYFGSNVVVKPTINVSYSLVNDEITRGTSATFTTDGYAQLSLKKAIDGVSIANNILTVNGTVAENKEITLIATSTLNTPTIFTQS